MLPDALEAVHEWMLMLSDETEIHPSIEAAVNRMRETLARHALDEAEILPTTKEELRARDELKSWFEREMDPPE